MACNIALHNFCLLLKMRAVGFKAVKVGWLAKQLIAFPRSRLFRELLLDLLEVRKLWARRMWSWPWSYYPGTCCFCSPVFLGVDPPQNKVFFQSKQGLLGSRYMGTHANIKIATQQKKMVGRLERQAFPFGKGAMIDFWGGNLLKRTKKVGAVSGGCHCAGRGLTTNYPHNIWVHIPS